MGSKETKLLKFLIYKLIYKPHHEKNLLYANKKAAVQPAHPCSLISAFFVHCLDSIILTLTKYKLSRLQLVSVAERAGLYLTGSQTPIGKFAHNVVHVNNDCQLTD